MVAMKDIQELSSRIAREFKPERIVLFGSHARGAASPDSDVDMLVVVPHESSAIDKSVEIRLRMRPGFPLDLIVRSPQKLRDRLALGDTFLKDILDQGVTLYEANDH